MSTSIRPLPFVIFLVRKLFFHCGFKINLNYKNLFPNFNNDLPQQCWCKFVFGFPVEFCINLWMHSENVMEKTDERIDSTWCKPSKIADDIVRQIDDILNVCFERF